MKVNPLSASSAPGLRSTRPRQINTLMAGLGHTVLHDSRSLLLFWDAIGVFSIPHPFDLLLFAENFMHAVYIVALYLECEHLFPSKVYGTYA